MMERKTISNDSYISHSKAKIKGTTNTEMIVAGLLLASGLFDHKKKKDQKRKEKIHPLKTRIYTEQDIPENANMDASYSQLIAADISSYRYGKSMTGFIQG